MFLQNRKRLSHDEQRPRVTSGAVGVTIALSGELAAATQDKTAKEDFHHSFSRRDPAGGTVALPAATG
jgi:hypothetical protein